MSSDDFGLILQERGKRLIALTTEIGMAKELFHQVVERTQNFREGFYSQKKIHGLGQSSMKQMYTHHENATEDDVLSVVNGAIQNLENIKATIMTEIDRIEKMS